MLNYVRQFIKIRVTPIFFAFLAQVTYYLTAVKILKKSIEWKILIIVYEFVSVSLIHRHDVAWYVKIISDLVLSYALMLRRFRIKFLKTVPITFHYSSMRCACRESWKLNSSSWTGYLVLMNTTTMIPFGRVS